MDKKKERRYVVEAINAQGTLSGGGNSSTHTINVDITLFHNLVKETEELIFQSGVLQEFDLNVQVWFWTPSAPLSLL